PITSIAASAIPRIHRVRLLSFSLPRIKFLSQYVPFCCLANASSDLIHESATATRVWKTSRHGLCVHPPMKAACALRWEPPGLHKNCPAHSEQTSSPEIHRTSEALASGRQLDLTYCFQFRTEHPRTLQWPGTEKWTWATAARTAQWTTEGFPGTLSSPKTPRSGMSLLACRSGIRARRVLSRRAPGPILALKAALAFPSGP